jgi:hypothetical protein
MLKFVLIVVVILVALAAMGRNAKQKAAVRGLRAHFPPIARRRLVGSFPNLDPIIGDSALARVFDWMLAEMYRRTGTQNPGRLMKWVAKHGDGRARELMDEVARDAVDRLPPAALQVIDSCAGRVYAAHLLEQSMTEAGERMQPALDRYI